MKISNTTKYAVYHLLDVGKDADSISKELKITKKQVETIAGSRSVTPKQSEVKDLMVNQTSNKKTNTVSIMTEAASMVIDNKKDVLTPQTKQDRISQKSIHHPFSK